MDAILRRALVELGDLVVLCEEAAATLEKHDIAYDLRERLEHRARLVRAWLAERKTVEKEQIP